MVLIYTHRNILEKERSSRRISFANQIWLKFMNAQHTIGKR